MEWLIFMALVGIIWLIPAGPHPREIQRQYDLQREVEETNRLLRSILVEMRKVDAKQAPDEVGETYEQAVLRLRASFAEMKHKLAYTA